MWNRSPIPRIIDQGQAAFTENGNISKSSFVPEGYDGVHLCGPGRRVEAEYDADTHTDE